MKNPEVGKPSLGQEPNKENKDKKINELEQLFDDLIEKDFRNMEKIAKFIEEKIKPYVDKQNEDIEDYAVYCIAAGSTPPSGDVKKCPKLDFPNGLSIENKMKELLKKS